MELDKIEFKGRFDLTNNPICAWSACQIHFKFDGSGMKIQLKGYGKNYFVIILDEKIIDDAFFVEGEVDFCINDLKKTSHSITLFKKTEYNIGFVELCNVNVLDGDLIDCKDDKDRKILFIGDSITCGFGIGTNQINLAYDPIYDDAYSSYASLTARKLDANCHLIACSGYGLMRNYGGNMENPMPTMMDKITPISHKKWDVEKWVPQIISINLGTNDFSENFIPNKTQFVYAYIDLIKRLKIDYPTVKILCTMGPVLTDPALTITRDYIETVVSQLEDVYFFEYNKQKQEDGYGLSYHPSKITHEKMALQLEQKIKEIMSW